MRPKGTRSIDITREMPTNMGMTMMLIHGQDQYCWPSPSSRQQQQVANDTINQIGERKTHKAQQPILFMYNTRLRFVMDSGEDDGCWLTSSR
mmetsp:Transcript_4867/g.8805  ORF Transcript_4867/g.8805 Transcript_4867/m.8805 type:complete len:92 (-) Transcript_4867:382-657(-)